MSQEPDLGGLLRQAQEMQERLVAAQAEAAERVVEGQAGGGVVKVTVTGAFDFRSVTIDPSAVDPDDVEMLQDLVLAAIHDAVALDGFDEIIVSTLPPGLSRWLRQALLHRVRRAFSLPVTHLVAEPPALHQAG